MTDAKKLAVLRAELRRVEGLRNPSFLRYAERSLLERASANGGTIAALKAGFGLGRWRREIPAAKVLIAQGLAEKVDEGTTFLRIRLTSKGEAFLSRLPVESSSTPRTGRTPALRETEGFYNNPRALSRAEKAWRARKRPVAHRDMALLAHLERKGAGAGRHHTRTRDEETGRARRPKHGGRKAYVERENPLSGKAELHVVARRHSPHPKYGWEYSFSYNSTRKNVVREVKTKRGVQTMLVSVTDWQEDAEKFFEDYDSGYYANTDLTIFALDAQGVKHPLTLDAVRRMADSGSSPASLAANPRRR
jgi:hypothetical protein